MAYKPLHEKIIVPYERAVDTIKVRRRKAACIKQLQKLIERANEQAEIQHSVVEVRKIITITKNIERKALELRGVCENAIREVDTWGV
jgi:hypothetical protein